MLIYDPNQNNIEEKMSKVALVVEGQEEKQDNYESFMEMIPSFFINAIRTEQTRRKYQARLNTFFDYISIPNSNLEERCDL